MPLPTRMATCHPEKKNYGHGLCATCYGRKWRADNLEVARLNSRDRRLQHKYGINHSEYAALLETQGGGCAICGASDSTLPVDHDHSTGAIRGILCHSCNVSLGHMKDNPDLLRAAALYLEGGSNVLRDGITEGADCQ